MANTEPRPSHETWVQAQFGPRAAAYVESPLHAKGEDLDYIAALAGARTPDRALDLGCGGGHVAYTIAPHCTEVVACDLSIDMVTSAAKTAQERGLGNITGKVAAAEGLPFGDREFDFLACRMTAHHWRDLEGVCVRLGAFSNPARLPYSLMSSHPKIPSPTSISRLSSCCETPPTCVTIARASGSRRLAEEASI